MVAKHVSNNDPPALMVPVTKDTIVPHEQSLIMTREFKKHGVLHQFISVEGGEHGLGGGKPADIKAAHAAMLSFVLMHMK